MGGAVSGAAGDRPPLRLVLASASPRRAELLASIGVHPEVVPVDVDESRHPGEDPAAYVVRVARAKAAAGLAARPGAVVLAADTTVALDGEPLGKPADGDDARRMLAALSGRTHQVLTAVVATTGEAVTATPTVATDVDRTAVTFVDLDPRWIDWYVATGEPLDKAGAYAIQGGASAFVESIRGSYSSVVGLPACHVAVALERAGILR